MRLVSLFAGVGGFDLGFDRAGFTPVGMCEIDPHARSVLERHWPDVPKHDDVTTLTYETFGPADVVTFGSPCQDLSIAGKRAGLDGSRSGLFLEAIRYIREMREATDGRYPRLAVWENVPGAYSSNDGADFAAVLESLVGGDVRRPARGWPNAGVAFGSGGSAEWRTLDSQHFGVPQRRRRIFLVYDPRGERAGEVLLEPHGLRRDPPQGSQARASHTPSAARSLVAGSGELVTALTGGLGSGGPDAAHAQAGWLVPVANALTAREGKGPDSNLSTTLVPVAFKVRGGKEGGGKGYLGSEDAAFTLSTGDDQHLAVPVAFAENSRAEVRLENGDGQITGALSTGGGKPGQGQPAVAIPIQDGSIVRKEQNGLGLGTEQDPSYTLDTTGHQAVAFALRGREAGSAPEVSGEVTNALTASKDCSRAAPLAVDYAVRRLTPTECERLQGFPDDWTRLAADGAEIADTHRYRMMGNAVTVNVVQAIAQRIAELNAPTSRPADNA